VKLCGDGVTRHVLLVGPYAIKVPRLNYGWGKFLTGLLCNMQERMMGTLGLDALCPVVWSIPGGWCVVMRRARIMTDEEFDAFDVEAFLDRPDYSVPAERKSNSFGWLGDRIVAIDYGS